MEYKQEKMPIASDSLNEVRSGTWKSGVNTTQSKSGWVNVYSRLLDNFEGPVT